MWESESSSLMPLQIKTHPWSFQTKLPKLWNSVSIRRKQSSDVFFKLKHTCVDVARDIQMLYKLKIRHVGLGPVTPPPSPPQRSMALDLLDRNAFSQFPCNSGSESYFKIDDFSETEDSLLFISWRMKHQRISETYHTMVDSWVMETVWNITAKVFQATALRTKINHVRYSTVDSVKPMI